MEPTQLQSIMYAIGFKPKQLRQYMQANQMLTTHDKLASQLRERDLDQLALGLVQGQVQPVTDYVTRIAQENPTVDPKAIVDSVLEKVLDMNTPRDLLSQGSRQDSSARKLIAGSFPGNVTQRRSELARLQQKQQLLSQLGLPFGTQLANQQDYFRAAMVDELTAQGYTRSEAVRKAVEFSRMQSALN